MLRLEVASDNSFLLIPVCLSDHGSSRGSKGITRLYKDQPVVWLASSLVSCAFSVGTCESSEDNVHIVVHFVL